MTKEYPILFRPIMSRQLPHGNKTMTRRTTGLDRFNDIPDWPETKHGHKWAIEYFQEEEPGIWLAISNDESGEFPRDFNPYVKSPYGTIGDRLWVRETWKVGAWSDKGIAVDYMGGNYARREWIKVKEDLHKRLCQQSFDDIEKAIKRRLISCDPPFTGNYFCWIPGQSPCRWRPGIHMPREASRMLLEVTSVTIERLQDISEQDAIREGVERISQVGMFRAFGYLDYSGKTPGFFNPRESFKTLICKINGPRIWDNNPWVWVIGFKVLKSS